MEDTAGELTQPSTSMQGVGFLPLLNLVFLTLSFIFFPMVPIPTFKKKM